MIILQSLWNIIYNKNNKGPSIDSWGTQQFMVPFSKNIFCNKTKKALFVR